MVKLELEAIRHNIEDENGITYFNYGRAEAECEFDIPKYLQNEPEKLQDFYAGWCSVNGREYKDVSSKHVRGLPDAAE